MLPNSSWGPMLRPHPRISLHLSQARSKPLGRLLPSRHRTAFPSDHSRIRSSDLNSYSFSLERTFGKSRRIQGFLAIGAHRFVNLPIRLSPALTRWLGLRIFKRPVGPLPRRVLRYLCKIRMNPARFLYLTFGAFASQSDIL